MNSARRTAALLAIFGFIATVWFDEIKTEFYLWMAARSVEKGHNSFFDPADQYIYSLERTVSNKRKLRDRLLSHWNGSIAAEGMVFSVKCNYSDTVDVLTQFKDDKRWNYWLGFNDEFSIVSIAAYKIKNGIPLTVIESDLAGGYHHILEESFGVPAS